MHRYRRGLEWQFHNISLNFRFSFRTVASTTAMTFVTFKVLLLLLLYVQWISPLEGWCYCIVDCTVVRKKKKNSKIAFGVINT